MHQHLTVNEDHIVQLKHEEQSPLVFSVSDIPFEVLLVYILNPHRISN